VEVFVESRVGVGVGVVGVVLKRGLALVEFVVVEEKAGLELALGGLKDLDDVVLVELAVAAEGFLEIGDGHELDEGGAVAVAAAVRDELDAVVFDLDALEEGADVFVGGVVFEVFDFDYGVEFVHGRFGPVVVGVGVVEVIGVFVGVGREGFFVLHAVVVVVVGVVEFALVGREVVVLVGLVVFG
jgi:hypothetical protein